MEHTPDYRSCLETVFAYLRLGQKQMAKTLLLEPGDDVGHSAEETWVVAELLALGARFKLEEDDLEGARRLAGRAVVLDGLNPDAAFVHGVVLYQSGEYAQAFTAFVRYLASVNHIAEERLPLLDFVNPEAQQMVAETYLPACWEQAGRPQDMVTLLKSLAEKTALPAVQLVLAKLDEKAEAHQ